MSRSRQLQKTKPRRRRLKRYLRPGSHQRKMKRKAKVRPPKMMTMMRSKRRKKKKMVTSRTLRA